MIPVPAIWTEALAVLRQMAESRLPANAPRCCAVQARCDKAGQWRQAAFFLEDMVASSIELGAIAYGTATNGCRQDGRWPAALGLLRQVAANGCEVSDIALNAGLACCTYGYTWLQALHLLSILLQRSWRDPKQSATGMNTAAKACESNLRWDLVLELVGELMARSEADVFSCSTAINACGRCQRWEPSLLLWQQFSERLVEPNAVAYGALCSTLSLGKSKLCGVFVEEMRQQRLRPNLIVANVALSNLLDLDHWAAALEMLAEMDASGPAPNSVSLRSVATSLAERAHKSARPLLRRLDAVVLQLLHGKMRSGASGALERSSFSTFAPLSSSVEAVEALLEHDVLTSTMNSAIERRLTPFYEALLRIASLPADLQGLAGLESLFGLGVQGTHAVLKELGCACEWVPKARLHSRIAQLQMPAGTYNTPSARPTAKATLAWRACLLQPPNFELGHTGATVSYGPAANALLTPHPCGARPCPAPRAPRPCCAAVRAAVLHGWARKAASGMKFGACPSGSRYSVF